jgi:hypothetical protein
MSENVRASERQQTPEEKSSATPPEDSGPTRMEREGLIRALCVNALQRKDPLAANLQMLNADLFAIAAQVNQALAKESPEGAITTSGFRAYEKKTDMLLKLARQIDRLSSLRVQSLVADAEAK